jgi:hypothetical protein
MSRNLDPEGMSEETLALALEAEAAAAGWPRVEVGRIVVSGEADWRRALAAGDVALVALAGALSHRQGEEEPANEGTGGVGVGGEGEDA